MRRANRSQASAKRIRNLIVVCGLIAIIFSASTYAWFIGMRTVNVSSFDVRVASADSLLLSLNGADWDTSIAISSDTFDTASYENNTNKWSGGGLIPMSSVGAMDTGASRMKIFEKASVTTTPGGYRLMASRVDNYSAPTAEEPDGYVVFDLFIKNFSGTQYIEDLNILDEEAIYLKMDSAVTVSEAGVANTGIENSVRVAFAQVGRVIATETNSVKIAGISCAPEALSGVTGICRTAQIWEPNDTDHEANAISWYDTSCVKRIGLNVTSEANYSGTCETIANGTSYPTYAVNDAITSADNVDVYDGTEYNSYTPNAKAAGVDTFTDTEKLLTGTSRPTFMMLAPNSITKLRIYIYIEGQDIDNYDFASIGKAISVNFGFTKDRFDMEASIPSDEITLETASEACFEFDSETGVISGYNYSNPECSASFAIPETIGNEPVTEIGAFAFYYDDDDPPPVSNEESDENINIENGVYYNNDVNASNMSYLASGDSFKLSGVKIPNTVTTIGSYAFAKNDIKDLILPASLISIDIGAFGNNDLTSLTLPNTVETIGEHAFDNNQISGELDLSNLSNLTFIPKGAFASNNIETLKLPSSIVNIGELSDLYGAFDGNATITSVNFEDLINLEQIGMYAFYDNVIENVDLSNSTKLETIGEYAFQINSITNITIPSSVTSIYTEAFDGNGISYVCIRGKASSAAFTNYGTNIWGWAGSYDDSRITWNCTD